MNKNLYIKIILFPIILTIISILTITIYNINQINNHYNKLIQQKEVEFENREKNYVYNKVRSVVEKIKYDRMFFENRIKQDLKQKVDIINSMINSYYNSNHKLLPPTTLKENIIKLVESYPFKEKDNYFFLIDMNSSKILSHKIASFKDKPMRKHTDITGTNLFETQKILSLKEDGGFQKVYFSKPTKGNKEFSKIVYVKKVPHFNWFIGTGEYLDVVEGDIQKAVLKELDYLEYDKNRYIFILEVYNKNGGKNFAKMLLNPNKPELVGNKISDDLVDAKGMYHRKEYLKGLKNSNDFYLEYYYKKPNTLKDAKKGTYFYYFDKWKWIIGAGFYFEDLENEINIIHLEANKEIQKEVINAILFSFVLTIIVALLSYIVARKLNKAFRSYINDIENLNSSLEEKVESKTQELQKLNEHLKIKAHYDGLTNLYNRYYFEILLKKKILSSKDENKNLSIIMFDIDHFKNINDKYGHNIGDKALIFLSNLVYKHIRKDDILCRWGGEEFMVLVELKVENAYTVAEHLRNIIEQDSANSNEIPDFTCSFGVLSLDDIISAEEAYNKVDTLLYKAKQNGRNRIEK